MSSSLILSDGKKRGRSPTPTTSSEGCLQVTILSAYDLPVRSPPLCVTVQVARNDVVRQTGPPAQRHKDRNSFKFSSEDNHLNEIDIAAPLPKLYGENVRIEILYDRKEGSSSHLYHDLPPLVAQYPLSNLRMNETTWLTLYMNDNNNGKKVGPNLRLHMTLTGPFRPEMAALINVAQAWFQMVDTVEQQSHDVLKKMPPMTLPDPKLLIVPAVPLFAFALVTAPLAIVIMILGWPFLIPLLTLLILLFGTVATWAATAYYSTSGGRAQLADLLSPLMKTLLSTSPGQRLVYQTGPRPGPVQLVKVVVPQDKWHKAILSVLIDFIGSSSYLVPFLGEVGDCVWAPLQTILIMALYENNHDNSTEVAYYTSKLKYLSFAEEFLPFTDIIPSATLGWLMEFGVPMVLNSTAAAANNNGAAGTIAVQKTIATTPSSLPQQPPVLLQQQQEAGEPSISNLPPVAVAD